MRLLVLPLLIFCLLGWKSDSSQYINAQSSSNGYQVIKFNDVPYDGKRIYIGPLKIETKTDQEVFSYAISNTGRIDLRLGSLDMDNVVVFLDPTFNHPSSIANLQNLVDEILNKRKLIKAGEVILEESIIELPQPPVVENAVTPIENVESPITPDKTKKEKKSKSTRPEPAKVDLGNGTTLLETPERKDSDRGKYLDKNNCPDLIIKDIEILKVNKFMIAIEYTIRNTGSGTAFFHGKKNTPEDNAFIQAHLSPTPKFTRSALLKGENPIRKEVGTKDGSLDKSKEFKGKMYLNVRGSTKLTPYLILNLDPYQTVRECNERNNRSYIRIDK